MTEPLHKQIDKVNKMPVNQIAKHLLKRAEQKPDPDLIYLYQLIEWGLDSGKVEVNDPENKDHGTSDLLEMAKNLAYPKNPQKAMDFLMKEGPDEGDPAATWVDVRELAKQKTPLEAAEYLAERLLSAVQEKRPSNKYPDD